MSDWESSRELIDFFRNDPAPTYPEAMQALHFSCFDSGLFNHASTFVVDGDNGNPLWFLARLNVQGEADEALIVYITNRRLPESVVKIAPWFSSDLADSDMVAYTAEASMLHHLRLGFQSNVEKVTLDELARRFAQDTSVRPTISVSYSRR